MVKMTAKMPLAPMRSESLHLMLVFDLMATLCSSAWRSGLVYAILSCFAQKLPIPHTLRYLMISCSERACLEL